jgi:deoxycytidine triphosphate deaminase
MSLLNDSELLRLLSSQSPIVRDFPNAVAHELKKDPFGPKSPVQPSSIDLHVGEIFLPGTGPIPVVPHKEHNVPPGNSVIVVSHEVLDIPADIGAVAFPLAGRGQRGLSMMNAGHIDPGYEGKLWFSFINLGRDSFLLSQGDHVATILFWKLSAYSGRPWKGRRGTEVYMTAPAAAIESIAGDALMLETRARETASRVLAEHMTEVRGEFTQLKNDLLIDLDKQKGFVNAEFKNKAGLVGILGIVLPVVATAIVTVVAQLLFPYITGVRQLEKDAVQFSSTLQTVQGEVKNDRSYLEAKSLEMGVHAEKMRLSAEQQEQRFARMAEDVAGIDKRLSKVESASRTHPSP